MSSRSLVRVLSTVLLSAGILVGCGHHVVPLQDARSVLLPSPQPEADLRAAIARALSDRGFTAEGEEAGSVTARYVRGKIQLRLQIAYGETQYQLRYLDSEGLGYRPTPEGGRVISDRYERLVRDLSKAIDDELRRPAREAQKAVEQEREHELSVLRAQEAREAAERGDKARERELDRQATLERERIRAEARRPKAPEQRSPQVIVVQAPPKEAPPKIYYVERGRSLPPPPPPIVRASCRDTLLERGHSPSSLMFCDGVEARCAVALLRAGHSPASLIHCKGVEPVCAESLLQRGDSPASLLHCH